MGQAIILGLIGGVICLIRYVVRLTREANERARKEGRGSY